MVKGTLKKVFVLSLITGAQFTVKAKTIIQTHLNNPYANNSHMGQDSSEFKVKV